MSIALAGFVGLAVQAAGFVLVYLLAAPTRGRSVALLYASITAVYGYALITAGLASLGIPWWVTNVLLALGLAMSLAFTWVRSRATRHPGDFGRWTLRALPSAAIVGVLLIIQTVAVVAMPELSIDGQLYHGPVLAEIVQSGTLWGWDAPNQYMFYTDLTMVGGVNLATFAGSAVFDNGLQLPHLLVLVLALDVLLARRFSRSWVRVAFAALIVASPVIWLQPRILYVDVAYGSAVACLLVIILTTRRIGVPEMLVAGVGAAAIVATKPTGLLSGALLSGVWLIVATLRRRSAGLPLWRACWPAALAATAPLILGMAFYARNLISFGNPVYPVRTSFGPVKLDGVIDLSVFASGERGAGLVDPSRVFSYLGSLAAGMLHGVAKPDYDPRAGGYGYIPLAILVLTVAIVAAQLVWALVIRRRRALRVRSAWRLQLGAAGLAGAILVIQPSSFDTRYVIGPTSVLLAAILMTSVFAVPVVDIVAAVCALALAAGQIAWTEANAYPGLGVAKDLRTLTDQAQPITPGNPWGRGEAVSWLPADECVTIAIQNAGGVQTWGMAERSVLATLPYGLYGEKLCNTVSPMQLDRLEAGSATGDPVPSADFLIFYREDVERWKDLYPGSADCWQPISTVAGSETYPQSAEVFLNACR